MNTSLDRRGIKSLIAKALPIALTATLGASAAATAHAQRDVVVNGGRLSAAQLAYLQRLNCAPIPDGRYWLDLHTGAWGYAGNPRQQGFFGDSCRVRPRHKSLSERGMLFRPMEIIGGGR